MRLRGWRHRARQLPTTAIVRSIAPHVIIPALLVWLIYTHLGPLVFGQPVVWSFRHVGAYYLPDIALLLLLAVVPDLVQAAYMTGTAVVDRRIREPRARVRTSATTTSRPRSSPPPTCGHASEREVSRMNIADQSTASAELYWLPLGAGGHVVRRRGRSYEAAIAPRCRCSSTATAT